MDFKSKKSLNNYIDRIHYDRKSIINKEQCNSCQERFGTTEELECHMKKSHGKESDKNPKPTRKHITSVFKEKGKEEQNCKAKESEKLIQRKHKCDMCSESFHTKRITQMHICLHKVMMNCLYQHIEENKRITL